MKKILVTGGAGFIGSNLCIRLVNDGHEVICLDNLSTGNVQNVDSIRLRKNFRFVLGDITNGYTYQVDEIYNLACMASPKKYQQFPIETLNTSVLGSINLLKNAMYYGSKILLASTSEIYGEPSVHPQVESYWGNVNTVGPRSCYDEGKRVAETYFYEYKNKYKIDSKIVRIFNTYGPRMSPNDGRVVSNFINKALNNEDITIYGNGEQTRALCYVDDTVNALIYMMNSNSSGPINIGYPGSITMNDLAKEIINLTDSKSKISFLPLPKDDPTRRFPNVDKAEKELGWYPKIGLHEGLLRTIEYYKGI